MSFKPRTGFVRDPKANEVYGIGEYIDEGAFGEVYKAVSARTRKAFAIKIMPKEDAELFVTHDVKREADLLQLLDFNHIMKCVGFFDDEFYFYLVLELCCGRNMHDLIEDRKRVPISEAKQYVFQLGHALRHVHRAGIVHRDVKPDNVMVTPKGVVKLCDFGLAAKVDEGTRQLPPWNPKENGVGRHFAPELVSGKDRYGTAVDVWAFGCLFYHLIVGKSPFRGKLMEEYGKRIQRLDYDIPERLKLLSPAAVGMLSRIFTKKQISRPRIWGVLAEGFFSDCCYADLLANADQEKVDLSGTDDGLPTLPGPSCEMEGKRLLRKFHRDLDYVLRCGQKATIRPVTNELRSHVRRLTPALEVVKHGSCKVGRSATSFHFWFQLRGGSYGVVFDDQTTVAVDSDGVHVQVTDNNKMTAQQVMVANSESLPFPPKIARKLGIVLRLFGKTLRASKMTSDVAADDETEGTNTRYEYVDLFPVVVRAVKLPSATYMLLSNGQIHVIYKDVAAKLVVCPSTQVVHWKCRDCKHMVTFTFSRLERGGLTADLAARLKVVLAFISALIPRPEPSPEDDEETSETVDVINVDADADADADADVDVDVDVDVDADAHVDVHNVPIEERV